jgi:multimeric flavodoxin WrbA
MKIAVINGSPKGELSVTMQSVAFIQKHFPQHSLQIINISYDIKKIESNPETLEQIIGDIKTSDGVIWATPVYYALVPSQLKRFIELIIENRLEYVFEGKYVSLLLTSIHFYDTLAANYLHAISDDFKMRYTGEFLAGMEDLMNEQERTNLLNYAEHYFQCITNKIATSITYAPVSYTVEPFTAAKQNIPVIAAGNKRIVVLTDNDDPDTNLGKMVTVFQSALPEQVELVNINSYDIKGGCLGCIHCSFDNTCVYKDGFSDLYDNVLLTADAVVIAGSIKDRYLSAKIKTVFDRAFFKGHQAFLLGKLAGFIISGPLRQNHDLRLALEMWSQSHTNNYVGIVTDEYDSSATVTDLLQRFAYDLSEMLNKNIKKPTTFLAISAHTVLRDFVYGERAIFKMDNRVYKEQGLYDFPQKNLKKRITNRALSMLFSIPSIKKQAQNDMKHNIIKPLQKVLE